MKYTIKVFGALCETQEFYIKGKEADKDDFGEKRDTDRENAEDYSCGNMQFLRREPTKEVLKKYNITQQEYETICDELEDKLSFGCCGLCS